MIKKIFLLTFLMIILTLAASAQTSKILTLPKPTPIPSELPPGNIELLDGYIHTRRRGIDSRVGDISKPDGLTIRYDIGLMAGVNPDKCAYKNECLWYKRQIINGKEVWLGLSKEERIFATFPKENANFYAQTKSSEDVTDFLIMVLTYKVKEPSAPDKTETQKAKQR